jgi:hypothetical protein
MQEPIELTIPSLINSVPKTESGADFWAYSLIADEYLKHKQPPRALKNFLDTVSEFPVILPEKETDAIRVHASKVALIERRKAYDEPSTALIITQHYKKQLQKTKVEISISPDLENQHCLQYS